MVTAPGMAECESGGRYQGAGTVIMLCGWHWERGCQGLHRPAQASLEQVCVPGPRSRHRSGLAAQKQASAAGQLKRMRSTLLLPVGFVVTLRVAPLT